MVPLSESNCDTQRQLTGATVGGKTYSYEYNSSGIRTRKTNYDGGYTEYYVVEGLPVAEQRFKSNGTKQYILRYLYDESNSPVGFGIYYPTASSPYWQYYYFGKNLQGDVIALYRSDYNSTSKTYTPTLVATYTYDPWGTPTGIYSASGTAISQTASNVAAYNPFRYRGYRYDGDTGFYYMSNRYYDPKIGRFINADDIDFLGADGSPLSYNLFAYCVNNPVNRFDDSGNLSLPNGIKVGIGALAIFVGIAATAATGGAVGVVVAASLKMAVTSAAIGAAGGAAANAVNYRVSTGSWHGAGKAALSGAIDGAADGFMWGGISAGATFTTIAAKGIKIQQIGRLKPSNKSGEGYPGVQYKDRRGSLKSLELHSPHKRGPHQQWHWQLNKWNPKTGGITGRSTHWTLFGRRF